MLAIGATLSYGCRVKSVKISLNTGGKVWSGFLLQLVHVFSDIVKDPFYSVIGILFFFSWYEFLKYVLYTQGKEESNAL